MGRLLTTCFLTLLCSGFLAYTSPPPILTPSSITINQHGQLVLSWAGDLWLGDLRTDERRSIPTEWKRLTASISVERDPVWHPDGQQLFYASDESGNFDIWKAKISDDQQLGERVLVVDSKEVDIQPSFARNGTMAWVKGTGPKSDIWLKTQDGQTTQLTSTFGPDHSPALHPDGEHICYVSERKGSTSLLMMRLDTKKKSTLQTGKRYLFPQWSPDGQQVTFSTRDQPQGLWVMDKVGSYCNILSKERAIGTWTGDGQTIALVEMPRNPPAYNGDPMIQGARPLTETFEQHLQMKLMAAPEVIGEANGATSVTFPVPETLQYEQELERMIQYLNRRYSLNQGKNAKKWNKLIEQTRSNLSKVQSGKEAEELIYNLISKRPTIKEEVKGKAAISSAHPLATAAGLEILEAGGNVVDAAVAISFALGVVEPDASGVGGYGEMLVYVKGMPAPTCIEFLTRVPEAASFEQWLVARSACEWPYTRERSRNGCRNGVSLAEIRKRQCSLG